ncbi:GatB/YqeY domain-containing protein [cf. Phormidesmis sp. LEGE 11477]|uniref:GatB/YqeY domain-containing protein n=1 Tax=cf. Phormidesmis sp. LEGE 11477 TaxID=1828680 RepID=UPI00188192A9|nr:GatB/YqeY domain-containing protein [cf. Phormidesmis sp. LEGE 11477]MBE9062432.1 GatB/YqeY domain-containing protein [cf. Phormidesmis sp. LEGE 11477]
MSLKDRISEEIKTAMKAKDKLRLETVRGIKKVILEKESEIRGKGRDELTEEEELAVVMQLAKQRRDSIKQFTDAGREELADKEAKELEILEEYLPAQLSDADIEAAVDEVIAQVGATSPRDMGKVMGPVMQKLKGQADGGKVQSIVKSKLAG